MDNTDILFSFLQIVSQRMNMATRRPKLKVLPNLGRRPRPAATASSDTTKLPDSTPDKLEEVIEKPEAVKIPHEKGDAPPIASLSKPAIPESSNDIAETEASMTKKCDTEKKVESVTIGRRRLIKPKVQIPGGRRTAEPAQKETQADSKFAEPKSIVDSNTLKGKSEAKTKVQDEDAKVVVQSPMNVAPDACVVEVTKDKSASHISTLDKSKDMEEKSMEKDTLVPRRSRYMKVTPNIGIQRKR